MQHQCNSFEMYTNDCVQVSRYVFFVVHGIDDSFCHCTFPIWKILILRSHPIRNSFIEIPTFRIRARSL